MQVAANDTGEACFEVVIGLHRQRLRQTARRLTGNHDEAEDLLQDTVVRAWTFWHRFQAGSNAKAWLHRILMNTFINGYRKKRRERELLKAAALDSRRRALAQLDSRSARADGVGDEVDAALETLTPEFRKVVEMVDLSDYSYREVAAKLECPIGTVMSRLHRARKQLQGKLGEYAVCEGYIPSAA
jgi:RNA polymerase sigma-70 factor (ECF subfamily)